MHQATIFDYGANWRYSKSMREWLECRDKYETRGIAKKNFSLDYEVLWSPSEPDHLVYAQTTPFYCSVDMPNPICSGHLSR
jgi:hypothetical protein